MLLLLFNIHHIFIQFDFLGYISELYLLGNVTLTESDIINVSELEYIRNVTSLVNQTPSRTLQNYIVWRFIMIQAGNMPQRFRAIKQKFEQVFQGISSQPSNVMSCVGYVNNIMGNAVAKLYKDEYFDSNARNQVSKIKQLILELFFILL